MRGATARALLWPSKRACSFCKRGLVFLDNQAAQRNTITTDASFALRTLECVVFVVGWSPASPRATSRLWPAQHGHAGLPKAKSARPSGLLGPMGQHVMVRGSGKSNGVLLNPSLDNSGSVRRHERSGEHTPSQKGRDGGEASIAHCGVRYSDG